MDDGPCATFQTLQPRKDRVLSPGATPSYKDLLETVLLYKGFSAIDGLFGYDKHRPNNLACTLERR